MEYMYIPTGIKREFVRFSKDDNLPIPVAIHTKSHQLPFDCCWNVCVLHNLPPNINHIIHCHLELAYQFVLSSRYSPGINLR